MKRDTCEDPIEEVTTSEPKKQKKEDEMEDAGSAAETSRPDNGVWVTQRTNESFIQYYKSVGVVNPEEWSEFYNALQKPLPTTFRITKPTPFYKHIRHLFKEVYSKELADIVIDNVPVTPPTPMPWYPEELGYHLSVSRAQLRKSESIKTFWKFLVSLTEEGFISRQEAVSMIPPLLLDVQPSHNVLDLCAAPGSKTAQLLEMINPLEGSVVANDVDYRRCYTLIHQTNRLSSPGLIVLNHEAQNFPTIYNEKGEERYFDRILCDVPCSGDGTLRKNMDLWKKWVPTLGLGIHTTQTSIAKRALQMLAVGGKMVYSTCSLNPVEDEAVICELLRYGQGTIELVDVSSELKGLKRRNGITTWKVFDKDLKWYEKHSDLPKGDRQRKVPPSCFPPTEEEVAAFKLDRCVRVLPHLQDTGGFFIALLKKTAPLPQPSTYKKRNLPSFKKGKRGAPSEEPFLELGTEWTNTIKELKEFYGITDNFPLHLLRTRSEKSPTVNFVSPGCCDVLHTQKTDATIRVINTGVKLFQRKDFDDNKTFFRICAEGLPYLLPYLNDNRKIKMSLEDFHLLFTEEAPKISSFSAELAAKLGELSVGSVVATIDLSSNPNLESISVPLWRAKASMRLYVANKEKALLRKLIYNEDTILEEKKQPKHPFDQDIEKEEKGKEEDTQDAQDAQDAM